MRQSVKVSFPSCKDQMGGVARILPTTSAYVGQHSCTPEPHLREGDDDGGAGHEAGDDGVRQEVGQPAQLQKSHDGVQAACQERHLDSARCHSAPIGCGSLAVVPRQSSDSSSTLRHHNELHSEVLMHQLAHLASSTIL